MFSRAGRIHELALAVVALALLVFVTRAASALELRVRGTPHFAAIRTLAQGASVKVVGVLEDENAEAVSARDVELAAIDAEARSCDDTGPTARTDDRGRFCFALSGPLPDRAALHFRGDAYLTAATHDFALDPDRPRLSLSIELESAAWSLAGAPPRVTVALRPSSEGPEVHPLRLALERSAPPRVLLAEGELSAERSESFDIDRTKLGAPGPATLVASVGRDPDAPEASATASVLISANAELRWVSQLEAVRPELGFVVTVGASGEHGPLDSGWVELLVDGERVGSAEVIAGSARVEGRFVAGQRSEVQLSARYVPKHPWLIARNDLAGELPIARAPLWLHLPWLVVGGLAAVWIFRAWWRPKRPRGQRRPEPVPVPVGGSFVLRSDSKVSGWNGRIIDAHSGLPIPSVLLSISAPSVPAATELARAMSDASGHFSLPRIGALPEGTRLELGAEHHSRLSLALPPEGQLIVAMVSRRRSLLEQLHDWAQGRGWDTPPLLTPSRVAAVASRLEQHDAERWALEVQRAVFGPAPPDEQLEASLTERKPTTASATPHKR